MRVSIGKSQKAMPKRLTASKAKKPSKEQYVLPKLNKAEEAMCAKDDWLNAGRSFQKRNPTLLAYRCLEPVAQYYLTRTKDVRAKQKELIARDRKPRS